mgnify:CR=1 FL=1
MKEIAIIFITVIVVLFAAAGCINLYKKKKYEKTLFFVPIPVEICYNRLIKVPVRNECPFFEPAEVQDAVFGA